LTTICIAEYGVLQSSPTVSELGSLTVRITWVAGPERTVVMPKTVTVATSGVGSPWYEIAVSLRRLMGGGAYHLEIDWTRHDHLNVRAVAAGECDIGVTMPPFVDWAMHGDSRLPGIPAGELRVIAAVNLPAWLVAAVERKAGLRTLRELGEARFPWKPIMPPADQLFRVWEERILQLHGFSTAELKSWGGDDPLGHAWQLMHQAADSGLSAACVAGRAPEPPVSYTQYLARNNLANGAFFVVNLASPWAGSLSLLRDLCFLEFDYQALRTVQRELGAQLLVLPNRIFPGMNRDLLTVGWRHQYIYGRSDTDPDLVRAILGALERPQLLENAIGASYTAVEPELVPGAELHPASLEWYEATCRPHPVPATAARGR
jgi:hypothetical protein